MNRLVTGPEVQIPAGIGAEAAEGICTRSLPSDFATEIDHYFDGPLLSGTARIRERVDAEATVAFRPWTAYIPAMRFITPLFCLTILLFSAPSRLSAQEVQDDSISSWRIELVEPAMTPGSTMFVLPPHLEQPLRFSSPTFFFDGISPPSGSPDFGRSFEVRPDLLAPLRAQWAREAQMGTFRAILGSIQIGGVAYLAYRHFAKLGPLTARPRPAKTSRK